MTCSEFARLQHLRLAEQSRTRPGEMRIHRPGPPPQPSLSDIRRAIIGRLFAHLMPYTRCPRCRNGSGYRMT